MLSSDILLYSDESNKSENEESLNNEGKILHTDNFITSIEKGRKHGKSRFNAFFSCYRSEIQALYSFFLSIQYVYKVSYFSNLRNAVLTLKFEKC